MDMKTVRIVMVFLFVGSVCGVLGHRYAENKHRDLYVNYEALTVTENGNQTISIADVKIRMMTM